MLFALPVAQIVNPAANNVTQSSQLDVVVRNPPNSGTSILRVLDTRLASNVATALAIPASNVGRAGHGRGT